MNIFGWICMIALMLFGLFMLGLAVGPFVISKIKTFTYRLKRYIEDEKIDIDKRSEERRNKDEVKRTRDFELANKKLDAKLNKIDKQIKVLDEKQKLAEELKKRTSEEKVEVEQAKPEVVNEAKNGAIKPETNIVNENIADKE